MKMSKTTNRYLLLFLILAFAFSYRMLLMHWETYPPGADIGLHNSVIYSITFSGNTDFFWNFYQMSGGLSQTFPGYHIFVANVIFMTGLPDFLAHSLVVSVFSTVIVAVSSLITRAVWGESTGLIVAFLVAISRFDIEMLLWGGFPNVATLMLMPLTFYLFLQRDRFSLFPFLASTTLLSGAVYLTHSLSAVMFVGITLATAFFALVLSKRVGMSKKRVVEWVLPVLLGALIVSPFLIEAVPAYLGANRETFTGGVSDIRQALLSTRILPAEIVVPLFLCVVFFFLFSKEYKGKYLTVPSLLFTLWVLVPMFFTQGYLVGLYTDYNRFLYFVLLPVVMLIGMGIDHGATFFARMAGTYQTFRSGTMSSVNNASKNLLKLQQRLTSKNVYSVFVVVSLLIAFLAVPIFVTPFQGVKVQSFYQVMTEPGYEAIRWARENTPANSVFVSDAFYGWWFSGFAQRPTLSAVDPQYLTLSREFEPAKAAKSLLDTDYVIDNGLIQVREDGGYIGRHNPMFLAKLNWSYFPYPFFNFNNDETTVFLAEGNVGRSFDLSQLSVTEMHVEVSLEKASVSVSKRNDRFNYTQIVTVYRGVRFVNMSVTLESNDGDINLYGVRFNLQTKGEAMDRGRMVGFFDEDAKVLGQLIFTEGQPKVYQGGPELLYTLSGEPKVELQVWAGAFPVSDRLEIYQDPETKASFLDKVMADNLASYRDRVADLPFDVFDYRKAVRDWDVSYVAVRDSEVILKFAGDPAFSLVFINDEVAVFKVKRSFNWGEHRYRVSVDA